MSNNRPLRAILMETFHSNDTTYNKGEIYNIEKFVTMGDKAMVFISDGSRTCLVTPSTIQIIAPEPKQPKPKRKKWPKKKRAS